MVCIKKDSQHFKITPAFSFTPIFRGAGAKKSQENFERPSFEKLENEQVIKRRQNKRPHDAL